MLQKNAESGFFHVDFTESIWYLLRDKLIFELPDIKYKKGGR